MTYPGAGAPAPSRLSFEQVAAVVGEAGALLLATTGAVDALLGVSQELSPVGFFAWNSVEVLAFCGLLTGLAGLARSRAAGAGFLPGLGLVTAFLGIGAFAAVSLVTYVDQQAPDRLNAVPITVTAVGMLLTGLAVVRAGHWQGWQRYMPLVCGLYAGVVELPSYLLLRDTAVFEFIVVGNWLTWVALNVGLWLATPAHTGTGAGTGEGVTP